MHFYIQYMSGDLRGERQFITEADFKYPLKVSKPQEVNLKRKYKIIGNNDIGFYFAVILFVAENLAELKDMVNNQRPRFNTIFVQSGSSSDPNLEQASTCLLAQDSVRITSTFVDYFYRTIDKSRQTARSDKIKKLIRQKQEDVREQRKKNSVEVTVGESQPAKQGKDIETSGLYDRTVLSKLSKISVDDPIEGKTAEENTAEEENNAPNKTIQCSNSHCFIRLLKSEETISTLTKLLDNQLRIVDEMRLQIRDLREKNEELNQKINNPEEFQAKIFANQNRNAISSYPPSGFTRSSDDHVHLGSGVWLPRTSFNEACDLNSTSLFVKRLCDMLFTTEELKESTVSGKDSNRRRTEARQPKKLDPTKVLAIKDITKYWLETLQMSDEAVDVEVSKVGGHIAAKIAELQRSSNKKRKHTIISKCAGDDSGEISIDPYSATESATPFQE